MSRNWELEFDALIERERQLMIAVVDASRAMHQATDALGVANADALAAFGAAHKEWMGAVQAINDLVQEYRSAQ